MKKIFFLLLIFAGAIKLSAQNEVPSDSIGLPPTHHNIKMMGDFALDMNLISPPKIPSFSSNMLGPDAIKDYVKLFQLPLTWILSKSFIPNTYSTFGFGFSTSSNYLQSSSFRLNDNMQLNTYGQYDMDGRRIPNRSALPWEKDNFMGGMELKFNKNFGIRIEVQQGRNPYYPY